MKKLLTFATLGAIALSTSVFASSGAEAPLKIIPWKFEGVLGTVDRQSAQRGFQVYKEVCASCHSLNRVAFRTLSGIGFSEEEIKALAATYTIQDGPNDAGDMFDRPGLPSDKFVPPFANEQAARAANNGAYPPDLSLIIKARPNGANYVYSLLTGYTTAPAHVHVQDGMHYNPYFPGGQIGMPAPLSADAVTYADGTPATLDRMARDVVNFLQWTAEPEMEQRHKMGIRVMLFLAIMSVFFFAAKKRVWKKIH